MESGLYQSYPGLQSAHSGLFHNITPAPALNFGFEVIPGRQTNSSFSLPADMKMLTCPGTDLAPFKPYRERDPDRTSVIWSYQSITYLASSQGFSPEELRLADYNRGCRYVKSLNSSTIKIHGSGNFDSFENKGFSLPGIGGTCSSEAFKFGTPRTRTRRRLFHFNSNYLRVPRALRPYRIQSPYFLRVP